MSPGELAARLRAWRQELGLHESGLEARFQGNSRQMIVPKGPDRVVAGRYRLVKVLGTGGMGTVWLAHDDLLHRQVAVKEVLPPSGMSASGREILRQRTLREARTAARLNHPNVVTIFDVVNDDGQPWIIMELVLARSLRDIVEEDGPLTPQQAAGVAVQVLEALSAAHALGIVHRDVKPGNVLIQTDGRAVLADFGIARGQDSSTITTSGVIVGSPSYIAPERARGERGGPESDLWSLGATLYSAVEGRPPYDRAGALATLTALVAEDPDPPSRAGPLWPVISGLLRRDPARRLGQADAALMLRSIAEGDHVPVAALPSAPSESAVSGNDGPAGRLEHAERITAFHPHVPQPTAPLDQEEAAASPSSATGEDVTPTPPGGFRAASVAASTIEHAPSGISPAGDATSGTGSAEPGIGVAELDSTSQKPRPGHTEEHARAAAKDLLIPGIADRPTAKPEPGDGRVRKQRWRLIWLVTAAAALIAVAIVLITLNTSRHHIPRRHPALAPTHPGHPTTRPAVSTSPASGPSHSSGSTSSPSRPSFGARAPVPAGWHRYVDPTGFSIAVPDGWAVSRQGTYVDVVPASGGSFLIIDQTDHPKPDPLADWQQQEANRIGTYPGYHRIRLQAIRYPQAEKAADWEWTYYKGGVLTHVLNRNILANSKHAYALYWSTPENEWDADFRIFKVFARTFQPAAGPPAASGS